MNTSRQLDGKVAVVLGCSAERGTGWAVAELLAEAGAKVAVAARRRAPLEELAERIGGRAFVCDAADPAQIAALAADAEAALGPLDVAVNCVGLPVTGTIAELEPQQFVETMNVDYLANVHFIRETAARMNDGGSIMVLTSISADQVVPTYAPYACAKAATDCLVRYAACEYGDRGIRVNSIQPGGIKTELASHLFDVPPVEELFASYVPLRRIGTPSDFADVVLWLSGPAFVTGLNLPVSGGNNLTSTPPTDRVMAAYEEAGQPAA